MKDEKKEETKPSAGSNASPSSSNPADTAGLFRKKLPTLIDNNRNNGTASDKNSASNKRSLDDIASEKKEEEKEESTSSSGNGSGIGDRSATATSIRRQDGVLFYHVNMEFPIQQNLGSARKCGSVVSPSYRRQQCKSWMIQSATRAMWIYLLYSRGILPVPVHEILQCTTNKGKEDDDDDDQHTADVAASKKGNKRNNNKNKNRKMHKTREALQRLDQDWNRLTAMHRNNHHHLEIVQVMIVLGSSWRRPKEVHLLDFGIIDYDLGNTIESTMIQDENDGTAAILESLQHSLSSRLIRNVMQTEEEAQQQEQQVSGARNNNNNGTTTSTAGPADQMTIFMSVTAKSYNDLYQKAQQEQQQQQQQSTCEEGLLSSPSSTLLQLQSLTLCRDFDLDQRAFAVSSTTTPTTGTTITKKRRLRPLVPSLQRCSKTLLKLLLSVGRPEEEKQQSSPRTTSTIGTTTRNGDDDDDDFSEPKEGGGENNVIWLSLSSTIKGFSLAE